MKTLKFEHSAVELIRAGKKTVTWRINDDKHIGINDELSFIDKVDPRDPESWEVFGTGSVEKIVQKRFKDLGTEDVDAGESLPDRTQILETYKGYYGPDVNDSTAISVIHFTFSPLKTKQSPVHRQMGMELAEGGADFGADGAQTVAGATAPSGSSGAASDSVAVTTVPLPKEVKIYADGGSRGNPGPSAGGFAILTMDDVSLVESGKFLGITTNNQAEYHSIKGGLEAALRGGAREVYVYMDSLLVINQMKGIFKVKNRDLWPIHQAIKELVPQFKKVEFQHVPRELNKLADSIVNKTLDEIRDKNRSFNL